MRGKPGKTWASGWLDCGKTCAENQAVVPNTEGMVGGSKKFAESSENPVCGSESDPERWGEALLPEKLLFVFVPDMQTRRRLILTPDVILSDNEHACAYSLWTRKVARGSRRPLINPTVGSRTQPYAVKSHRCHFEGQSMSSMMNSDEALFKDVCCQKLRNVGISNPWTFEPSKPFKIIWLHWAHWVLFKLITFL